MKKKKNGSFIKYFIVIILGIVIGAGLMFGTPVYIILLFCTNEYIKNLIISVIGRLKHE